MGFAVPDGQQRGFTPRDTPAFRLKGGAEWINLATDWSSWVAKDKGHFNNGLRLVGIAVAQDNSVPID